MLFQTLYQHPRFHDPEDLPAFASAFGAYMGRLAAATAGASRWFELGNEDNGSNRNLYTEVGRHGAAAVRAAQPFAQIANSGTAFVDLGFLERQHRRGLVEALDALCVHPYTNNSTASQEVAPEPGGIPGQLARLRQLAFACGGMKRLWSTEYGWPNGDEASERARADLYVRQMAIGEAGGLMPNGLYTFGRDYRVVKTPAGVALQAFARLREACTCLGLYRSGQAWVALYERPGWRVAMVWTPDAAPAPMPVTGSAALDLFGNRLAAIPSSATRSPVYILDPDQGTTANAITAMAVERRDLLRQHPGTAGGRWARVAAIDFLDSDALHAELLAWADERGCIDLAEQACVATALDWYLRASGATGAATRGGDPAAVTATRMEASTAVLREHGRGIDIPSVRFLLDELDRVQLEWRMAGGQPTLAKRRLGRVELVRRVLARFVADGIRTQASVFANLYMEQGARKTERLALVPGQTARILARASSYAATATEVEVALGLPEGWTAKPAQATVPAHGSVWVPFDVQVPINAVRPGAGLSVTVAPADAPARTTWCDQIEMVPAVSVDIPVISGPPPVAGLALTVRNEDRAPVSGLVRLLPAGRAGASLGRLRASLPAEGRSEALLPLGASWPLLAPHWLVDVDVCLDDGRSFLVPRSPVDFCTAVRATRPVTVDAVLDEWTEALPLRLDRDVYTRGSFGGRWSPEDCSAVVRHLWDDRALHLAIEVRDQTFFQQCVDGDTWKQDSVQVIVAGTHERRPLELILALTPRGPQAWRTGTGGRTGQLMQEVSLAVRYAGNVITYEASIPWLALADVASGAQERREVLYAVAVNDDDAIGGRKYLERFIGSIVHGKDVAAFARMVLIDPPTIPPSGSVPGAGAVFFHDFESGPVDDAPEGFSIVSQDLQETVVRVEDSIGMGRSRGLHLIRREEARPQRFLHLVAPVTTRADENYVLSAAVRGSAGRPERLIGVCGDLYGHVDQVFACPPAGGADGWMRFERRFRGRNGGTCNLIIALDDRCDLVVDDLQIRPCPQEIAP